ncbi:hypothetical protein A2159_02465 [Candidatus Woesebacteria bacterium RBG_13_34_9]|uniref:Soluble ligand binding domain-containing protein n=1 Tax=Candidatus Woesebacteria bacterium RBG_13_34_9 TaxID=1802477 RepID=A0A1F7X8L6_9BACT|nr:MAG: hypothetical protein A2159_02465 [Candidatus Woesebacteria bacterium RBG_13_34_9]
MSSEKILNQMILKKNSEEEFNKVRKKFDFEKYFNQNKAHFLIALLGLILLGLGLFFLNNEANPSSDKIEVLESATQGQNQFSEIVVEIAGAVEKPGVYKLPESSRIQDLLILAGGISADADREWMEKYINKAAKLSDGQKIFIQKVGDNLSSTTSQLNDSSDNNNDNSKVYQDVLGGTYQSLININTATLKELDTLPGIGPVYGQNIIEGRPYSSVEELLSRRILKQSTFEKIKEKITVF